MPKTELHFNPDAGSYSMDVHAAPEDGKANREIIRHFKRELKKDIEIVSGLRSREKTIRILPPEKDL